MPRTFNKTILIGLLGEEPEEKTDKGTGKPIVKMIIGNSIIKDGEERVIWNNVYAGGKQADLIKEYAHKGDLVCVEGTLLGMNKGIMVEHITFLTPKRKKESEVA